MSIANSKALLEGLIEYHEQLNLHIAQLQQEYGELETRWGSLDHIFTGDAADQFRGRWQDTVKNFHEYLDRAQQTSKVLEKRIIYLTDYVRPSDALG